jgi:hypothetical protein
LRVILATRGPVDFAHVVARQSSVAHLEQIGGAS